jgi:hypothetical protein
MNIRSLLVELVRIEITRARLPYLRSLLPGAAFLVAALLGYSRYFSVGLGIIAVMGTFAIAQQVGRDRTSGAFDYFSTLPVSGLVLFGARVAAAAVFIIATSAILYTLLLLLAPSVVGPFIVVREVRVLVICIVLLFAASAIVIALLSRFSPTAILVVPMVTLMVVDVLSDKVMQNSTVSLWFSAGVARAIQQPVSLSLFALSLFAAAFVAATSLAVRTMQPSGEPLGKETYEHWRAAWETDA